MGFNIEDLMSKDKKVIRDTSKEEKKQGRPKKEVTRNNIVTTYLNDDEKSKLTKKVEKSGLGMAAYLRKLIMEQI